MTINILDNEPLYNVIVLGGMQSPGQVRISGHDRVHHWQVNAGPSLEGARVTLLSTPPIEFTCEFFLLRDESLLIDDFETWPPFRKLIESTLTGASQPRALDIYHPALRSNGIRSVVQATIGGEHYDGVGGMHVAIKFQEFKTPRKSGGTPLGAGPTKKDPNQDLQDQLKALAAQVQATPRG